MASTLSCPATTTIALPYIDDGRAAYRVYGYSAQPLATNQPAYPPIGVVFPAPCTLAPPGYAAPAHAPPGYAPLRIGHPSTRTHRLRHRPSRAAEADRPCPCSPSGLNPYAVSIGSGGTTAASMRAGTTSPTHEPPMTVLQFIAWSTEFERHQEWIDFGPLGAENGLRRATRR